MTIADANSEEPWRARAHLALVVLGGLYLALMWLEGAGSTIPSKLLPRTPVYFLQIAALFPRAAVNVIDYRAEAWLCNERTWREIDTRPYFPIDPDDKENRFQRVMHFFRDHRPTMHALDEFLVNAHKSRGAADGVPPDATLGGIRVLSLRLPLPVAGERLERTTRKPLSAYPDSVRHPFYFTKASIRTARCGYPKGSLDSAAPDAPEIGPRPPKEAPE